MTGSTDTTTVSRGRLLVGSRRTGRATRPGSADDGPAPGRPSPVTSGRWWLALIVTGYTAAGVALAFGYRYAITPDGTAYVDIARDYASGHWADAVNGLWSPLYSWLLAVPLRAGIDPILAGQLIQVLAGAAALLATRSLLSRLRVPPTAAVALVGVLAVVVLTWSVGGIGPDLLPVALTIVCLRLMIDADDRHHPGVALASGVVAGLGYLAKASFLPFFVLLTVVAVILRVRAGAGWRPQLVRGGAAALGFAALVLPWAAILTITSGHLSFGDAATYNLAIIGPGHDSLSVAHPPETAGLLPPPNARATSAWTDPVHMPLPHWSPFTAAGGVHELRNIGLNAAVTLDWLVRFWVLAPVVLVAAAIRSAWRGRSGERLDLRIMTTAAALLVLVYLPWLVESRYLFPAFIVSAVLAVSWWTRWRQGRANHRLTYVVLAVALLLLLAQPVHRLLGTDLDAGREPAETARTLAAMQVGGNIASDSSRDWSHDLYVSFHLGAHYFGAVSPSGSDDERRRSLDVNQIDYVLVHGSGTPGYLTEFTPVGVVPDASTTVFRRVRGR